MKLSELFTTGGTGVIASSNAQGEVNLAIYSIPHIIDEETVAWGMTNGRTFNNIWENPRAAYLYRNPGQGYSGSRLTLELKQIEDSGKMLDMIRSHTRVIVGEQAAPHVSHVAYFRVVEIRPLF